VNSQEVLENPKLLLQLLKTLCKNGVFILEGAAKEVGQLRKLVGKFGFIRTTHYGYGFALSYGKGHSNCIIELKTDLYYRDEFTVKSEKNASNVAYTSTPLCVHTDLPYYVYPPSVQLLHWVKQYEADVEGGASQLVDGFRVAAQLKAMHPQSYEILSRVPVEFEDIGKDFTKFHKVHHSPTFV